MYETNAVWTNWTGKSSLNLKQQKKFPEPTAEEYGIK